MFKIKVYFIFKKNYNEFIINPSECGIEECSEGCKEGTTCDCNPRDTDVCKLIKIILLLTVCIFPYLPTFIRIIVYSILISFPASARFDTGLQIMNPGSSNTSQEIIKQVHDAMSTDNNQADNKPSLTPDWMSNQGDMPAPTRRQAE